MDDLEVVRRHGGFTADDERPDLDGTLSPDDPRPYEQPDSDDSGHVTSRDVDSDLGVTDLGPPDGSQTPIVAPAGRRPAAIGLTTAALGCLLAGLGLGLATHRPVTITPPSITETVIEVQVDDGTVPIEVDVSGDTTIRVENNDPAEAGPVPAGITPVGPDGAVVGSYVGSPSRDDAQCHWMVMKSHATAGWVVREQVSTTGPTRMVVTTGDVAVFSAGCTWRLE